MSRDLLLVSSSKCHPHGYLDHCANEVAELFASVQSIVFVPYARPGSATHEEYTDIARTRLEKMDIGVRGLHEFSDPSAAIADAAGVFIGGGNTFVLLNQLYADGVMHALRSRILDGMPYMGTSAGSNVAGASIGTSNDMPIVHPPSFQALGVVPFNINPHFPKTAPDPTHMGETRADRIGEFHTFNNQRVIGIHEDNMLRVRGDSMTLLGPSPAFLFSPGTPCETLAAGTDISHLLA